MTRPFHGFCIAGTHSGTGKTTVTLGILAALRKRGLRVQPFKCGPDYIDPGHHRQACGVASRNLDTWMMGEEAVKETFEKGMLGKDVSVIEGVMGLFDGASSTDLAGSTAHVSQLLDVPVILVVDAKPMARSIAALVKGFVEFEPDTRIAGIIANRVGSERHRAMLQDALAAAGLPPLLGALPAKPEWATPERHLGLIADTESGRGQQWYDAFAAGIAENVNLDRLLGCTVGIQPSMPPWSSSGEAGKGLVRLGIARDDAFHFYYEDNLDLLRQNGAELIPFSPLADDNLPEDADGLYIGGGFPEMFAKQLAANESMKGSVRAFAGNGGHIYAECGGFMYLCESLRDIDGKTHKMCGLLPVSTRMESRRSRLGYLELQTIDPGLFGEAGMKLRGHEFHWSSCTSVKDSKPIFEAQYTRQGKSQRIGMHRDNVYASYAHIHFASNPAACGGWVERLRDK